MNKNLEEIRKNPAYQKEMFKQMVNKAVRSRNPKGKSKLPLNWDTITNKTMKVEAK